jgi:hypothetical protein
MQYIETGGSYVNTMSLLRIYGPPSTIITTSTTATQTIYGNPTQNSGGIVAEIESAFPSCTIQGLKRGHFDDTKVRDCALSIVYIILLGYTSYT